MLMRHPSTWCFYRVARTVLTPRQDFRSSDGLYNMVKERYPDVVLKGRDLFDASLFRDTTSTSVFYSFIAELKRKIDVATPSSTHHFLKTLDSKNKLLRSYTQNIDGLEERVGLVGSSGEAAKITGTVKGANKLRVKDVRNVQLHGDIHRVRCVVCCAEYPCGDEHLSAFLNGTAPSCPECLSRCMWLHLVSMACLTYFSGSTCCAFRQAYSHWLSPSSDRFV